MLFHPASVHIPIALLALAWGVQIGQFMLSEPWKSQGNIVVSWCLVLGTVALLPSLLSGSLASEAVSKESTAYAIMERHEILAYVLIWLAGMLSGWRIWRFPRWSIGESIAFTCAMTFMVGLMTYSAWLGGTMVYEYGVGVTPIP